MRRPKDTALICGRSILAAVLLLASLNIVAAQIALQQYSVDWNNVYDKARPKSLQSGCPCSLLNSTCTPGCCCDSNCPEAAVASFESAGSCLAHSFPQQQLAYCTDDGPFAKVSTTRLSQDAV